MVITLERVCSDEMITTLQSEGFLARLAKGFEMSEDIRQFADFCVLRQKGVPQPRYTVTHCGEFHAEPTVSPSLDEATTKLYTDKELTDADEIELDAHQIKERMLYDEQGYPCESTDLNQRIGYDVMCVSVNRYTDVRPITLKCEDSNLYSNPTIVLAYREGDRYSFIAKQVDLDRLSPEKLKLLCTDSEEAHQSAIPEFITRFTYTMRTREWKGLDGLGQFAVDLFEESWNDDDGALM